MICICHAAIRDEVGARYVNCGESCTAVVEHRDLPLEIAHWTDEERKPGPSAVPSLPVERRGGEIAA